MATNPNDTAYPRKADESSIGLTKREYFAAMAFQGLMLNQTDNYDDLPESYKGLAETAVKAADDLINELNKEVKP